MDVGKSSEERVLEKDFTRDKLLFPPLLSGAPVCFSLYFINGVLTIHGEKKMCVGQIELLKQ